MITDFDNQDGDLWQISVGYLDMIDKAQHVFWMKYILRAKIITILLQKFTIIIEIKWLQNNEF